MSAHLTSFRNRCLLHGAAALAVATALVAGCGGDACDRLADEFANCGSSSASVGGGGPVCTDKEKMQAQCVIDAKIDQATLCKIKNQDTSADANQKQAYDACYAN
jgi:hypothetical protein